MPPESLDWLDGFREPEPDDIDRIAARTGMTVEDAQAALERLADDRYRRVVEARSKERRS